MTSIHNGANPGMLQDRVLMFDGVHNFRDYGGYAVAGGGRLKRAVLWRSGQHHGASDADLERIAALQLASVFDLRSSSERTSHPCRRPAGFTAAVHVPEEPARQNAPHIAAAQATTRQRDVASTRESLMRNYGRIAFRPELMAIQRRYFAALAEGRGPSLVNCMAGKDRTGITVALLHHAVGVHRDDILADYVLTNTAGDAEARIRAGMDTIIAVTGPLDEPVLRVLMGVEPEYLERAFAAIEDEHGSVDTYLAERLGVDAAMRERLKSALVE